MKTQLIFTFVTGCICYSALPAVADYTLVLKNGGRITVQSYREDGGIIKFKGLGGEIGIEKDQIQAIRQSGEADPAALDVSRPAPISSAPVKEPVIEEKEPKPPVPEGKLPVAEETPAEQKAKEEKAYQEKIRQLTERLKELRDRYSAETRGNKGPDPAFFTTEEAFQRHQDDLLSRLRDAQNNPAGPGSTGAGVVGTSSNDVPPPYTERQRLLSELRNQMNQLENQRQSLIDEMRQKGFDTGSLFLE
jgi:hypothetical protein